jgi:surface protein
MLKIHQILKSSRAAIDLASIMVGIIVIGLIGGVISATVFAVIPWAQDNAAKQQLDPIASAESAYRGLSTSKDASLQDSLSSAPAGTADPNQVVLNSTFTGSAGLAKNSLLSLSPTGTYCVIATTDGKDYHAYSKSGSGKWFYATSSKTQPSEYTGGNVPCVTAATATDSSPAGTVDPVIDNGSTAVGTKPTNGSGTGGGSAPPVNVPNTTTAIITVNCPAGTTYSTPFYQFNGTVTVDDVSDGKQYINARPIITVTPNTTYTVKLTGTYNNLQVVNPGGTDNCLRTVDAWGDTSKTTSVGQAFSNAINLVFVPDYLPANFTQLIGMFTGATSLNSPNITKWDMTKVQSINSMFQGATSFNQDISKWDVSNILSYRAAFFGAKAFNQNISNWNTSKSTDMQVMFANTTSFSQDISGWDVTKVITYASFYSGSKLTATQVPVKFKNS